jgi:hypothetical protein
MNGGGVYGFASDPDDIEIEAVRAGDSPHLAEDMRDPHGAVKIVDPEPGNTFILTPEQAEGVEERARERSEGTAHKVGWFVDRLGDAIAEARFIEDTL